MEELQLVTSYKIVSPLFLCVKEAQRKSSQKETPRGGFALCGGRQGLRDLDRANF
jgi:hypothetical protein